MEALKREGRILRRSVTRLENSIDEPSHSIQALQNLMSQFKVLETQITDLNKRFMQTCEEDDEELEKECDELASRPANGQLAIANRLQAMESSNSDSNSGNNSSRLTSNVINISNRLPKLDIPKFSGQITDWLSFSDLFTATVINNNSISDGQKLQYLKLSVTGTAAQLIHSIGVTDGNFSIAWKLLQGRYHHPRSLVNEQIKRLFEQTNVTADSSTGLHQLLNKTLETLRTLEALDRGDKLGNDFLVYWLLQRLDPESRRNWELSLVDNKPAELDELCNFIERRARAIDSAGAVNTINRFGPRNSRKHLTVLSSSHADTFNKRCICCNEEHYLGACKKYLSLSIYDRKKLVQDNKLCFNCLKFNHGVRDCKSRSCNRCSHKHHSSLHFETVAKLSSDIQSNKSTTNKSELTGQSLQSTHNIVGTSELKDPGSLVLLQTALVQVTDVYGRKQVLRALLDGGSQANLISESCVQRLGLLRHRTDTTIQVVSGETIKYNRGAVEIQISSSLDPNFNFSTEAHVLPKITEKQPRVYVNDSDWSDVRRLPLSDPSYNCPGHIDLLLGAEVTTLVTTGQRILSSPGRPIALQTVFGWVLTGRVDLLNAAQSHYITVHHVGLSTDQMLQRFWELDRIPEEPIMTNEDRFVEEHFHKTHTRTTNGSYRVRLPFKPGHPKLGDSFKSTLRRFNSLEYKLERLPERKQGYHSFMDEYADLNHMKLADNNRLTGGSAYYIPHHAIYKPSSTTTKVRVVFDASSKTTNGRSLNDELLAGPRLQDTLFNILLRFRMHRYSLCADIVKMFRMCEVAPEDQCYQRILWRSDSSQSVKVYELQTVTYGTKCAPYLATKCLQQLAEDEATRFPLAVEPVKRDFYVDDLLTGRNSIQETCELKTQIDEMLRSGGFILAKWASNSSEIVKPEESECNRILTEDSTLKILGVEYSPKLDKFTFSCNLIKECTVLTKRTVLSKLAHLFDPLGWISPVTFWAKRFIQILWQRQVDWDQEIPTELQESWKLFECDLSNITQLYLPRFVGSSPNSEIELHGFGDASMLGYCAAVYIRIKEGEQVSVHLLASKTKVSPIQVQTIPRLELCAAHLLAKLLSSIQKTLNLSHNQIYAWSDSEIVLCWLKGMPTQYNCFVANRVSQIQLLLPNVIWNHISGQHNPADIGSRGAFTSQLINNKLWWSGPEFLSLSNFEVKQPDLSNLEIPELKNLISATVMEIEERGSLINLGLLDKFSSWNKVQRVTAYISRFISNSNSKCGPYYSGQLSVAELERAVILHVKAVQMQEFSTDIAALHDLKILPKGSRLIHLDPFMDSDGIIRVGGRLQQSQLSYPAKHPIILPAHSRLTDLIMDATHRRMLHAGPQLLLSTVRQEYWVLYGKNAAKRAFHRCLICFRHRSKAEVQKMAPLPSFRVTPSRPFSRSACDFCGPILLKAHRGKTFISYKSYVAVFVCLTTHSVHLEAVSGLSTEDFLAALRRFTARRGLASDIFCDNGTNFHGANSELKRLLSVVMKQLPRIQSKLGQERITFHFSPPASPHHGGLWESAVKSMKTHLVRTMGNESWTFEEFSTGLAQIEAVLNSRPLTAMTSDPSDLQPLTPSHFLTGTGLLTVPEPDYSKVLIDYRRRYNLLQLQVQSFWKRWSQSYLQQLQARTKWKTVHPNLQINDMVLLRDKHQPPTRWSLGRITKTHPGHDGLVRVITVRTSTGVYKRPITSVAKLPII